MDLMQQHQKVNLEDSQTADEIASAVLAMTRDELLSANLSNVQSLLECGYVETLAAGGEIHGHVVKAFYTNGVTSYALEGWWESSRYSYSDTFPSVEGCVTHWMPLPEPPKEEVTHEQD